MQFNNVVLKKIKKILARLLPFTFWLFLILGFDTDKIAVLTLTSAAIHEAGHIIASLILSGKFSFKTALSGFRISFKKINSYKEEIIIAFAGPLVNIIFFMLFYIYRNGEFSLTFAAINLMTALSNLLPIEGYDGYRIISCATALISENETVPKVLKLVSFITVILLCFFSLYVMARFNGGYWVYFIFVVFILKKTINDSSIIIRKKKRENERFQEISRVFRKGK